MMKKLLLSFLMICSLQIFAQIKTPSDFAFITPFYEAENKYIVFSPKAEDTKFIFLSAFVSLWPYYLVFFFH